MTDDKLEWPRGTYNGSKKVWVTWLPLGEGAPAPDATITALNQMGLNVSGAPWIDDLEKVAWLEHGSRLLEPDQVDLWLVAGRKADFESSRIRYGLSLVRAMVADGRQAPLRSLGQKGA